MEYILYSTNCPKCNILEKKLNQKNISFTKITDFNEEELLSKGFTAVPVSLIDNKYYDFKEAVDYINTLK